MAELKSYIDGTKAVVDPEEMRDPELRELVEKLGNVLFQTTLPVVPYFPVSRAKTARCLKTPFWQPWKA